MAIDVKDCEARLARGEQLPAGVAWNPDHDPPFYPVTKEQERIANDEISVSWDGKTVTDRKTGEVTHREQPDEYKVNVPLTLAESQATAPASAGGDTVTTDNAPTGGARRATGRTGGT